MPRKRQEPSRKMNKSEAQAAPVTREQALKKIIETVNSELEDCIGSFVLLDVALEGELTDTAGKNLPQVLLAIGKVVTDARQHIQTALNQTYQML